MERIVDTRTNGGKTEYLVKWDGYATDENTWEPPQTLESTVAFGDWESCQTVKRQAAALGAGGTAGVTEAPPRRVGSGVNMSTDGSTISARSVEGQASVSTVGSAINAKSVEAQPVLVCNPT